MTTAVDDVLVQWGDRLFYPANRSKAARTPVLTGLTIQQRAQALRQRIHATVVRRAPQVMVKVTGAGRGMGAIAAHLRYIAKTGRLWDPLKGAASADSCRRIRRESTDHRLTDH